MREYFHRVAVKTSQVMGSPAMFAAAMLTVIVWIITGPMFEYSLGWQLIINSLTSIVTFAMVILIQNTQNRDSRAIHLKLDELLRVIHGARSSIVDVEELSDDELDKLASEFKVLHDKYSRERNRRSR
jgi:low affinity Fe/Cu permease